VRIAVIPARGGSKRIPRKNVKVFCGKPMLAWSIETVREAGLFDHIIVSTDDPEIASVAREWGAEAPFMRPAELADDHAGTTAVIAHATQWALGQEWPVQVVCCIYATAPFVRAEDIESGLKIFEAGDWTYTFGATEYAASIFRSFRQSSDGGVEMLFPEHFTTRSQDLSVVLHDAGQFYWGRPSAWIEGERIFERHSAPVVIPRWRVQDIDTQEDWTRAELIAPSILGMRA
jgi:N-acylneuraminate cytidylyltransferase